MPFLRRLFASTRAAELAPVPWSDAQKAAFLDQQFDAQRAHYTQLPDCRFYVIARGVVPIGRLYLQWREKTLHIVDISLVPEEIGYGLTTTLFPPLAIHAGQSGRGLSLSVARFNRAVGLYHRLGFGAVRDAGVYVEMERAPDPQVS